MIINYILNFKYSLKLLYEYFNKPLLKIYLIKKFIYNVYILQNSILIIYIFYSQ